MDPETKEVLGPNKAGEICFKSVMLMKGYIGKDRKEYFDEEGFLKTGDIGYYDDEGYFYIVDRLKELIKYNAYQVCLFVLNFKILWVKNLKMSLYALLNHERLYEYYKIKRLPYHKTGSKDP